MESKKFIRDYVLGKLQTTSPTTEINKLSEEQSSSANFGYSVLQAGDYLVFYENSTTTPRNEFLYI